MTILTAGYGNRGFDGFLALMREHGVTHLVDVRSVPQSSYWEDFRRERLALLMRETEIKYVYMGDTLGGVEDSPVLCKDPESVVIEPLRQNPKLEIGLRKLIQAAAQPERVICLMCGCLRPHRCHRSRLLGPALVELGVEVLHLDDRGRPVAQEQVEREAKPQGSLF
ncbi:MAG: DUF488 domain-containing protein [Fimbriimonadaceae bacterium]|nr:DUF488 domain-containing protein [Fimbriimonadaceae bacterium]